MIKICRQNKESVTDKIKSGKLDLVTASNSNLVDDIIRVMHQKDLIDCIKIPDKRKNNSFIPFNIFMALSIAAKMKVKTALTDIPYAISDHRTLDALGYNIISTDKKKGVLSESNIRFIIDKYTTHTNNNSENNTNDFIEGYYKSVQDEIMPKLDIHPNIHILDCTEIEVELKNENYEESEICTSKDGHKARGYKLSSIRGITGDSGIIEDIRFDSMNTHDLTLSDEMLKTTPVLKQGDTLINDRGFLSRELMNYFKTIRGVDTYIPLKDNMNAFKTAVRTAIKEKKWYKHPNKRRKNQQIAFVGNIGDCWDDSKNPKHYDENVELNACVIWFQGEDKYAVIVTTDLEKTARQIVQTYELRPEIEEDFRQLKDFWKLEDFHSTKLNVISFHIVCVLFGYLYFQLFTMMEEGEQYLGKSLPIILKNYESEVLPYLICYVDDEFGIYKQIEIMELYANYGETVKNAFRIVMA